MTTTATEVSTEQVNKPATLDTTIEQAITSIYHAVSQLEVLVALVQAVNQALGWTTQQGYKADVVTQSRSRSKPLIEVIEVDVESTSPDRPHCSTASDASTLVQLEVRHTRLYQRWCDTLVTYLLPHIADATVHALLHPYYTTTTTPVIAVIQLLLQSWQRTQSIQARSTIQRTLSDWTVDALQTHIVTQLLSDLDTIHASSAAHSDVTSIASSLPALSMVQQHYVLDHLCTLPDIISNCYTLADRQSIPSRLRYAGYYGELAQAAVQHAVRVGGESWSAAYVVSKACRIGQAQAFAQGILQTATASTLSELQRLVHSVQLNSIEPLIEALLADIAKRQSAGDLKHDTIRQETILLSDLLLSPSPANNPSTHQHIVHLLTHRLLIQRTLPLTVLHVVVDVLYVDAVGMTTASGNVQSPKTRYLPPLAAKATDMNTTDTALLDDVLTSTSQLWSTQQYINSTAHAQQHKLTQLIAHALSYYKKHATSVEHSQQAVDDVDDRTPLPMTVFSQHNALTHLLTGVTNRLSTTVASIRSDGMLLASLFSSIVDPQHPIQWNEADEEDQEKHDDIELKQDFDLPDDEVALKQRGIVLDVDEHRLAEQRQNAAAEGEDEWWTKQATAHAKLHPLNNEADDTYDDLHKVPRPLYLRDAVDLLTKHDNHTAIKSALSVLPTLIRKQPSDLSEVAYELVRTLINVGTSPSMDAASLNVLRLDAMEALLEAQPHTMGVYVAQQISKPNYTAESKLEMLQCIARAAQQLAAQPKDPQPSQAVSRHPKITEAQATPITAINRNNYTGSSDHQAIITERMAGKTRRFASKPTAAKTTVNHFVPVADLWFYALLHDSQDEDNKIRIWQSVSSHHTASWLMHLDSVVLRAVIDTLSLYILLTSNHAVAIELSRQFYHTIVVAIRYHTDAGVRSIVLLGLNRVVIALPGMAFATTYDGQELNDLLDWLISVTQSDSAEECQNLAVAALQAIRQSVGQTLHMDQAMQQLQRQQGPSPGIKLIAQQ